MKGRRASLATGVIVVALAFWPAPTKEGQFPEGMERFYDPSAHCVIAVHLRGDPPGYFSC